MDTVSTAREVFSPDRPATPVPSDRGEFFAKHIRPNEGGRNIPWSFDRHEYLMGPVADETESQVYRKAAQVGMSTYSIARALHAAGALGYHVGYYLPTDDFIRSFVQSKFDILIDADETLARMVVEGDPGAIISDIARKRHKRADHTQLKIVGRGQLWFQGCQKMQDVKSIPLDMIILDEVDELVPELAAFIDDRILHSTYRRRIALSQPSVPGFGIDAEFTASDQKHFLLRCRRCRQWTCLEESWPGCLIQVHGEWRLVCSRCHAQLPYLRDRAPVGGASAPTPAIVGGASAPTAPRRAVGGASAPTSRRKPLTSPLAIRHSPFASEWVAKHPDRPVSGYHISQLYGPAMDAARVASDWAKAQKSRLALERFTISILGFPFAGDRQPINDEVFSAACNPAVRLTPRPLDGAVATWAGIDVGDVIHLVIGSELPDATTQTHWLDILTDWDAVHAALRAAGVRFFMIDARPEKTAAKKLCRSEGVRGAICYFPQGVDQPTFGIEDEKTKAPVHYCKAPRSDVLDDMCDDIIGGAIRLPSERADIMRTARSHFRNLVKDRTATGRWEYKTQVENHFALAICYMRLARLMARGLGLGPAVHLSGSEWTIKREEAPPSW